MGLTTSTFSDIHFRGTWAWAGRAEKTGTHHEITPTRNDYQAIQKLESRIAELADTTHFDFYLPEAEKADILFLEDGTLKKAHLAQNKASGERWGAFIRRVVETAEAFSRGNTIEGVEVTSENGADVKAWRFRQTPAIVKLMRDTWIKTFPKPSKPDLYGEQETLPARCRPLQQGSQIDAWLYQQMIEKSNSPPEGVY